MVMRRETSDEKRSRSDFCHPPSSKGKNSFSFHNSGSSAAHQADWARSGHHCLHACVQCVCSICAVCMYTHVCSMCAACVQYMCSMYVHACVHACVQYVCSTQHTYCTHLPLRGITQGLTADFLHLHSSQHTYGHIYTGLDTWPLRKTDLPKLDNMWLRTSSFTHLWFEIH